MIPYTTGRNRCGCKSFMAIRDRKVRADMSPMTKKD